MVNEQTNQEVEFHATSYKNYKEKSNFKRKRGEDFSFFLVHFFFKKGGERENFSLFKNPP
jgi:hypothetical protein